MAERILTLFGEEIVPEQVKTPTRGRAKKKQVEALQEEINTEKTAPEEKETGQEALSGEHTGIENTQVVDTPPQLPAEAVVTKTEAATEEKRDIIPEDWQGNKQYYTIGEVAKLFNVKTSHIRFWTNEFKLKVRTTRKGDRLFTPSQIKELRAIHHLVKGRGFTLAGAKAKLKEQNKRVVEKIDLKLSLQQLRNTLLTMRNNLYA